MGDRMNPELLSAAATIQGAHIQAKATYLAAFWGAFGLISSIFITWFYTQHLQKKARVAETRRVVYLELVEAYSKMITGFQYIPSYPQNYIEYITNRIDIFSASLEKAMFICATETKEEIFYFYKIYIPKGNKAIMLIQKVIKSFNRLNIKKKQNENQIEGLNLLYSKLEELKIESPNDLRIENISDLIKIKKECIKKNTLRLRKAEEIYKCRRENTEERLKPIIHEINDKAINIMYLLRQEIDIKTNRKLDKEINEKMKSL